MRHLFLSALLLAASAPASAISLINGMGGDAGFGQLTQGRNDDGSSGFIGLPFAINFFGNSYNGLWVNNNGNVSFQSPLSAYTPTPFPVSSQPMIAPFWGDVDTRPANGGSVYIGATGIGGRQASVVTWNNVGYFSNGTDKLNNFQLALVDRNDTGSGNFDIHFRYDRLEWTTGGASGGSGGLGGTPAQAGYDAGDGVNFFTLPGSRTAAVLDLATSSNVSLDTEGLWVLTIRNGSVTVGDTPETPLLPNVVTPEGFQFTFNVPADRPVFIDPVIAVGYDYVVNSGPNIASAWFPELGDADGYQLFGWDGAGYTVALGSVLAEQWFDFAAGGVTRFAVRGIDPGLGLDPSNTSAFVTGLRFTDAGTVSLTMSPFSIDTGSAVPEPATWAMMILGFGLVGGAARRRRAPVRMVA